MNAGDSTVLRWRRMRRDLNEKRRRLIRFAIANNLADDWQSPGWTVAIETEESDAKVIVLRDDSGRVVRIDLATLLALATLDRASTKRDTTR